MRLPQSRRGGVNPSRGACIRYQTRTSPESFQVSPELSTNNQQFYPHHPIRDMSMNCMQTSRTWNYPYWFKRELTMGQGVHQMLSTGNCCWFLKSEVRHSPSNQPYSYSISTPLWSLYSLHQTQPPHSFIITTTTTTTMAIERKYGTDSYRVNSNVTIVGGYRTYQPSSCVIAWPVYYQLIGICMTVFVRVALQMKTWPLKSP